MRKVEVEPYCGNWAVRFEEEASQLRSIFGDALVGIHHIGSTSVPGLGAKPINDILPVVSRIDEVDNFNTQMADIGYEAMGEFGIAGRRYFRKGGDDRTHHTHVFEMGDENIVRHLAFRDYLRARPDVAAEYGELKQRLAAQFPEDVDAYIDGKDAFVREKEREALAWYRMKARTL